MAGAILSWLLYLTTEGAPEAKVSERKEPVHQSLEKNGQKEPISLPPSQHRALLA